MRSALLVSLLAACSDAEAGSVVVADAPLAGYRRDLLEMAFDTASALPTMPHVKDRSLAQSRVVEVCLELDQPQRALGYVSRIDNWRRGAGHAAYSRWCARRGDEAAAKRHADLAREVCEKTEGDSMQDWQREEILSALAPEREPATFEAIAAAVGTGGFDAIRGALADCARLYDRSYADADLRWRAKETIVASWGTLPIVIRIEMLEELARSAVEHADPTEALALVAEAEAILESATWLPEHRVPTMARLAGLRARAGDVEEARLRLDDALATYDTAREEIVDIYRAGALRAVAEGYHAMGAIDEAVRVYARAVDEGVVNPNSRPRAMDLSATCASMARLGVEPGEELRARMAEIRGALAEPW